MRRRAGVDGCSLQPRTSPGPARGGATSPSVTPSPRACPTPTRSGRGTSAGGPTALAEHLAAASDGGVEYANLAIRGRLVGPGARRAAAGGAGRAPGPGEPGRRRQRPAAARCRPRRAGRRARRRRWGGCGRRARTCCSRRGSTRGRRRSSGGSAGGSPSSTRTCGRWRERHGAAVLDQWGAPWLQDPRMWDTDRIHLTAEGHRRIALAAAAALGVPVPWRGRLAHAAAAARTAPADRGGRRGGGLGARGSSPPGWDGGCAAARRATGGPRSGRCRWRCRAAEPRPPRAGPRYGVGDGPGRRRSKAAGVSWSTSPLPSGSVMVSVAPPRLGPDRVDDVEAALAQRGHVGLEVVRYLQDQSPQRACRHRREPGDQGQRGLPAAGGDLHPALGRAHVVVADQFHAEHVDVEVPRPVLVRHRHGQQLELGDRHAGSLPEPRRPVLDG